MKKKLVSGFTLIELLVSIAIIALLSTIVLWVISTAKDKNADAAVKQALSSIPAQSGIFALDHGGMFGGPSFSFCASATPKSAYPIVYNAAKNVELSFVVVNNVPMGQTSLNTATCNNSATAWVVEVPLKNKNVGGTGKSAMFCVDSTGFAGNRSTSMGPEALTCPTE